MGRAGLVAAIVDAVDGAGLVSLAGDRKSGKTRVLAAVGVALRERKRPVVAVAGRRRFLGEQPDDDRVREALATAAAQHAVVLVDDAQLLSADMRAALRGATCVIVGERAGVVYELPPLDYPDADTLLRELLLPARLIPDVLVERLAIRAGGNPGLIVALAHDIVQRGGLRRHAGSDEWYVAADELDTLLAPPGPAWFAMRALEDLPVELAPVVRTVSALGPRFAVDEVAAVIPRGDPRADLARLARDGVLCERGGWYEFADRRRAGGALPARARRAGDRAPARPPLLARAPARERHRLARARRAITRAAPASATSPRRAGSRSRERAPKPTTSWPRRSPASAARCRLRWPRRSPRSPNSRAAAAAGAPAGALDLRIVVDDQAAARRGAARARLGDLGDERVVVRDLLADRDVAQRDPPRAASSSPRGPTRERTSLFGSHE